MVNEPLTNRSQSGGGIRVVLFAIGPGNYILNAASVSTEEAYNQMGRIYYLYQMGDGSTVSVHLKSGWVHQNCPLCIDGPRKIVGPGWIYGAVYMQDAASTFRFAVQYDKELI